MQFEEARSHHLDLVIDAACEVFQLPRDDIVGERRYHHIIKYRHAAMIVARDLTGASYPVIARAFGKKDHTTVIHALRKRNEPELIRLVEKLKPKVNLDIETWSSLQMEVIIKEVQ